MPDRLVGPRTNTFTGTRTWRASSVYEGGTRHGFELPCTRGPARCPFIFPKEWVPTAVLAVLDRCDDARSEGPRARHFPVSFTIHTLQGA